MKKWYPRVICKECAEACGGSMPEKHIATFHNGTCDVCLQEKNLTEPRDYRYPDQNKLIERHAKIRAKISMNLKDVGSS